MSSEPILKGNKSSYSCKLDSLRWENETLHMLAMFFCLNKGELCSFWFSWRNLRRCHLCFIYTVDYELCQSCMLKCHWLVALVNHKLLASCQMSHLRESVHLWTCILYNFKMKIEFIQNAAEFERDSFPCIIVYRDCSFQASEGMQKHHISF